MGRRKKATQSPLAFLHRPWALERRQMPRHATVLANHKGFDEVLTVGNNAALGARLGVDVERAVVIQGYKGDPDRTIALIGRVGGNADSGNHSGRRELGLPRTQILRLLEDEFGSFEGVFGFTPGNGDATGSTDISKDDDTPIRVIAIMNAFHPAEVEQVEAIARNLTPGPTNTTQPPTDGKQPQQEHEPNQEQPLPLQGDVSCRHVLYLTGAIRELGLQAARERGMAVVCVGHRTCEEWGIRYMAKLLRERWPGLRVDEILEDENERVGIETTQKGVAADGVPATYGP
ncbi:hypothetical protein Micbo1qcDRAFT_165881 [Microdochium bolleyi]|uniref:Uncharacterized protein n=1 Tax=Microdochium bolleyi TaxID=196109 RepID=A0A136IVV1_9PEZI|nr:hypothetical protein Micbo1qcDRAFT_165881 [Microdochium bolleyi]